MENPLSTHSAEEVLIAAAAAASAVGLLDTPTAMVGTPTSAALAATRASPSVARRVIYGVVMLIVRKCLLNAATRIATIAAAANEMKRLGLFPKALAGKEGSFRGIAGHIFRHEGIIGFLRGSDSDVFLTIPIIAAHIVGREVTNAALAVILSSDKVSTKQQSVALLATRAVLPFVLSLPLSMIRSAALVQLHCDLKSEQEQKFYFHRYGGLRNCLRRLYRGGNQSFASFFLSGENSSTRAADNAAATNEDATTGKLSQRIGALADRSRFKGLALHLATLATWEVAYKGIQWGLSAPFGVGGSTASSTTTTGSSSLSPATTSMGSLAARVVASQVIAMVAAVGATVASHPLEVVRCRMLLAARSAGNGGMPGEDSAMTASEYGSVGECVGRVLSEHQARGDGTRAPSPHPSTEAAKSTDGAAADHLRAVGEYYRYFSRGLTVAIVAVGYVSAGTMVLDAYQRRRRS